MLDTEKNTHIFITKDLNQDIPDSMLDRIDFEVLQKNEFLENIEEVLQKNEFKADLSRLPEDDLPLSDLKEENCFNFIESDYEDDNDVSYTGSTKKLSKPRTKVTKAHKVKPRAKRRVKVKLTDIKYEEVDDLSLADLIQKCGADDKVVKARQKFLNNKAKLKDRILAILDSGQFNDLGDNIKMTKEIFVKIFNKYDKCDIRMLTIKPGTV